MVHWRGPQSKNTGAKPCLIKAYIPYDPVLIRLIPLRWGAQRAGWLEGVIPGRLSRPAHSSLAAGERGSERGVQTDPILHSAADTGVLTRGEKTSIRRSSNVAHHGHFRCELQAHLSSSRLRDWDRQVTGHNGPYSSELWMAKLRDNFRQHEFINVILSSSLQTDQTPLWSVTLSQLKLFPNFICWTETSQGLNFYVN